MREKIKFIYVYFVSVLLSSVGLLVVENLHIGIIGKDQDIEISKKILNSVVSKIILESSEIFLIIFIISFLVSFFGICLGGNWAVVLHLGAMVFSAIFLVDRREKSRKRIDDIFNKSINEYKREQRKVYVEIKKRLCVLPYVEVFIYVLLCATYGLLNPKGFQEGLAGGGVGLIITLFVVLFRLNLMNEIGKVLERQ